MDLTLNVQKRGLSTSAETINEEFTLHYGHIFKGEKGDKGEKGVDGKDGERGADGKSAYQQAVEAGYKGSEADFKELLLSYPNKADKDGYYPKMSVGVADDVKNGNTKYLAATPSGDPMHYAYVDSGAEWNADTGFWELNGLADLTNDEMRRIYAERYPSLSAYTISGWWGANSARTNICNAKWSQAKELDYAFVNNETIEVASVSGSDRALPTSLMLAFAPCPRLREIATTLNLLYFTAGHQWTFEGDTALEEVRIENLKTSLDFHWSPRFSKESLLYMIKNSVQGAEITITLHPEVYFEATSGAWEEEVTSAINEYGENITLAEV